MTDKQIKLKSWLEQVREYAIKQEMPMRLTDRIEECCDKAYDEDLDWSEMNASVKDILDSIELKRSPLNVEALNKTDEEPDNENGVSDDQIRGELEKMAEKCHNECLESVRSYSGLKAGIVNEVRAGIGDITNFDVNFDKINERDRYLNSFREQKRIFVSKTASMIGTVLESVSDCYDRMFNNVKAMLGSLGTERTDLSAEAFYNGYKAKKSSVEKEIISRIENSESYGKEITELGEKTCSVTSEAAQKYENQRKIKIWIPAIVVAALIVIFIIIGAISSSSGGSSGSSSANSEITLDGIIEVANALSGLFSAITEGGPVALLIIGIVIAALIYGYVMYAKAIRKNGNEKIKAEARNNIQKYISDFDSSNVLMNSLDEAVSASVNSYENRINEMFAGIFSSSAIKSESARPEDPFDRLKKEWTEIKAL